MAGELERSPLRARDLGLQYLANSPHQLAPSRGRTRTVADDALGAAAGSTTLNSVHAAMLLQKSGRANALRALLAAKDRSGGRPSCAWPTRCRGLYPQHERGEAVVGCDVVGVSEVGN